MNTTTLSERARRMDRPTVRVPRLRDLPHYTFSPALAEIAARYHGLVNVAHIDDGDTYERDTLEHRDTFSERVRDYLVERYGHEADGMTFRCGRWRYRVLVERGVMGTSWVEEVES